MVMYYCWKCKHKHQFSSKIGKRHRRFVHRIMVEEKELGWNRI